MPSIVRSQPHSVALPLSGGARDGGDRGGARHARFLEQLDLGDDRQAPRRLGADLVALRVEPAPAARVGSPGSGAGPRAGDPAPRQLEPGLAGQQREVEFDSAAAAGARPDQQLAVGAVADDQRSSWARRLIERLSPGRPGSGARRARPR
jgi:hypothetical protein